MGAKLEGPTLLVWSDIVIYLEDGSFPPKKHLMDGHPVLPK